jgi:serine/threonine protein kinase
VSSPVRLGRSPRNDLPLQHPFASAWHGLLEFDGAGVRYTDLGSTNGSLLDGAPVAARQPVPVPPGGRIQIGGLVLTVPPAPAGAGGRTEAARAIDGAAAPEEAPRPRAGRITELMQRLATASGEPEAAWRQVLLPGAVIDHFELQRELGRGGFGVVFEARDRRLGRLVAFKAVRPGRQTQVAMRQRQLQLEAEAVASLAHPNIVSLYDLGSCQAGPYLVFELLRGQTLQARLGAGLPALGDALEWAIQVAWALDAAHGAGVIHRDLKPSNVFLCESGLVKVLDFGIAEVLGGAALRGAGTPGYMAPEQWTGGRQDARTDVFGAAAMLCEQVTGRLPYRTDGERSEALGPAAAPALDGVPGGPLRELLRAALDPDPERRPTGGHEWLAGLLEVQQALDEAAPPGVAAGPAGPWRRWRGPAR